MESKCTAYIDCYKIYAEKVIYDSMIKSQNTPNIEMYSQTSQCLIQEIEQLTDLIKTNHLTDEQVLPILRTTFIDSIEKYLAIISASVYLLPCSLCNIKINQKWTNSEVNTIPVMEKNDSFPNKLIFVCKRELEKQIITNYATFGNEFEKWEFQNVNEPKSKFKIDMIDIIIKCHNIKTQ